MTKGDNDVSVFQDAFKKVAEVVTDITSLEVTTYKGEVVIQGDKLPTSFDEILANAQAQADFRILASSKSDLDKDQRVLYHPDITSEEKKAHNDLFNSAQQNRTAIIEMFKSAIEKDLDLG
jgi:hypothetical protein